MKNIIRNAIRCKFCGKEMGAVLVRWSLNQSGTFNLFFSSSISN